MHFSSIKVAFFSRIEQEQTTYSDLRSVLEALNSLVLQHKAVAEIKTLVQRSGVKVFAHWIKAHVGHPGNKKADELAKAATKRHTVDMEVKLTTHQVKRILLACAMEQWQSRWNHSATGRRMFDIFPRVSLRRLHCDFYVNQVLTGHGTFSDHQVRLRNNLRCPCGAPVSSIQHSLYVCPKWNHIRETSFPRDFQVRTLKDLCLHPKFRLGVISILANLLEWTLSRLLPDGRRGGNA